MATTKDMAQKLKKARTAVDAARNAENGGSDWAGICTGHNYGPDVADTLWMEACVIAHSALTIYYADGRQSQHFGHPASGGRWPDNIDDDVMAIEAALIDRLKVLQGQIAEAISMHGRKVVQSHLNEHGYKPSMPVSQQSTAERCIDAQRAASLISMLAATEASE